MSDFINTINVIGDDALCGSIIDKSVTEFKDDKIAYVGEFAFYQCKLLEVLEIPSVTEISAQAFRGCACLTKVKLPSVTTIIGAYTFYNCTALTMIDFSLLKKVDPLVFNGIPSLTALVLRNETMCPMPNTNVLGDTPIANGTGYIYVPRNLIDKYKTATNWSTYTNQFRALEDYTVDGTIYGELDESKI